MQRSPALLIVRDVPVDEQQDVFALVADRHEPAAADLRFPRRILETRPIVGSCKPLPRVWNPWRCRSSAETFMESPGAAAAVPVALLAVASTGSESGAPNRRLLAPPRASAPASRWPDEAKVRARVFESLYDPHQLQDFRSKGDILTLRLRQVDDQLGPP